MLPLLDDLGDEAVADVASIPDPEFPELPDVLKRLPSEESTQVAQWLHSLNLHTNNRFEFLTSRLNDQLDRADRLIEELRQDDERYRPLKAASNIIARLAEKTEDSEEDLLMKALALYETVLEAKSRDQRIVIVTKDYKFVQEITGIGRPVPEPSAEVAAS